MALLNSFRLHFLSNGTSERAKTECGKREDCEGAMFKHFLLVHGHATRPLGVHH